MHKALITGASRGIGASIADTLKNCGLDVILPAPKFIGTLHTNQIRLVNIPKDADKMGCDRTRPLRPD